MPHPTNAPLRTTHDARRLEARWLERLAGETDRVKARGEVRAWLRATLYQWRYSPLNVALLRMQRPTASFVASAACWRQQGRPLRPGAEPLWVLAPASSRRYIGVPVYDVEDTEGPPPRPPEWRLAGRTRRLAALEQAAGRLGVTLEDAPIGQPSLGTALPGRRVRLRRDVSEAEQAVTLVHELAHVLLGHLEPGCRLDVRHRETEAEAVSWVVAKRLRLRTRAPEYLAAMGAPAEALRASTRRIGAVVREVLRALEPRRRRAVP
jgi:hypothetical protein